MWDKVNQMLNFLPIGMDQDEINKLGRRGITYDKSTKNQLLRAYTYKDKPTRDQVLNFEKENALRLPEDYIMFLITHNGGHPDRNVVTVVNKERVLSCFYALNTPLIIASLDWAITAFKGRIPDGFLPIAYDPSGNQFLIDASSNNSNGNIFFWAHDSEVEEVRQPYYGNMRKISNSFSDLLSLLEGKQV
jgi:hypothetical protein